MSKSRNPFVQVDAVEATEEVEKLKAGLQGSRNPFVQVDAVEAQKRSRRLRKENKEGRNPFVQVDAVEAGFAVRPAPPGPGRS